MGSVRRAALCCDAGVLLVVVRGFLATAREREDSEELGEVGALVVGGSEKEVHLVWKALSPGHGSTGVAGALVASA